MRRTGPLRTLTVTLLLAILISACGAPQGSTQTTPPTDAPAAPTAAPATDAPTTAAPTEAPTAPPAAEAQPTTEPTAGGSTLRIGRTAAPDSLNPGAAYISEAFDLFGIVYDNLITSDELLKPQPQLAKEWKGSADGKVWTFTLHDGAKWHDGKPVTAEDVVFTWTMIKGFSAFALIKSYTDGLVNAKAINDTTVELTFDAPVANWLERFGGVPILPKHIWSQFKDEKAATEFENKEMIGSGPFKLAEYKQGEFARLTAVKDHYLDAPKIDEIIFKVYQNNDATVQALKTGEIDLIAPQATAVRSLKDEANVTLVIGKGLGLADIIINTTAKKDCPKDAGKCTGHPALKDVKVRQALAYATDKQQLIDVMLFGLGEPGRSLVMPGHGEAYNSSMQDYAYDVAKANQILDEAGYKDTDGDGIREMPGDPKTPLSFRFSWPSDQISDGARFAELLRDMWKQAGIEIQPQGLQNEALTAACCPAFDYDIIRWGWGAGPDPASLLYIATTDQIPTGTSETGYSNPEYDKLYKEQLAETDPAKRKDILWKMQEILVRDVPYIIPYYAQSISAYRKDRFTGFIENPDALLAVDGRRSYVRVTPVK